MDDKTLTLAEFSENNPDMTLEELCDSLQEILIENASALLLDEDTGTLSVNAREILKQFVEEEL